MVCVVVCVINNQVCYILQVKWPTYSIPTMQIVLISKFVDKLGVTSRSHSYEPPFILHLENLEESMDIHVVSVTNMDAQMAIMARIKED